MSRIRVVSVFLTFTLLTGCGSDHQSAKKPAVRLAVTRGGLLYIPVYLARSLGYYDQEGLDVSLQEMAGTPKSMQSLLGGSSDVGSGGFMSVVMMNAERRSVQAFFVLFRYSAFIGLVSPNTQKSITRIEDLDGTTVGVSSPGSDGQMLLNFICLSRGVNPAHVKVVGVGAGMSAAMALEHGTVDAGLDSGMNVSLIRKRHPNTAILFDLRSRAGLQKYLGVEDLAQSVLYAKADWIRDHPDTVRRIVRATFKASEWARSHSPAEVRDRLPSSLLSGDSEVDLDAIGSMIPLLSPDGMFSPEQLEAARKILAVTNESIRTGQAADLSQSYTNQFISRTVGEAPRQ
ncbi:MAG TPA: ABC transporter substrate-binding protein [Bryobacteraceae bacterium]|nr:ABC transporter substrate-binding protein [Bryobacteraceae bacterium]